MEKGREDGLSSIKISVESTQWENMSPVGPLNQSMLPNILWLRQEGWAQVGKPRPSLQAQRNTSFSYRKFRRVVAPSFQVLSYALIPPSVSPSLFLMTLYKEWSPDQGLGLGQVPLWVLHTLMLSQWPSGRGWGGETFSSGDPCWPVVVLGQEGDFTKVTKHHFEGHGFVSYSTIASLGSELK